jgi:thiamine-phosphate pyrophosphorylase
VVAIGGITLERVPEVMAAGASAVAVISDLLTTGDPERRVREYVRALR